VNGADRCRRVTRDEPLAQLLRLAGQRGSDADGGHAAGVAAAVVEVLVGDEDDRRIAVEELRLVVVPDRVMVLAARVQPAVQDDGVAGVRDVDDEHAARVAGVVRVRAALGEERDVAERHAPIGLLHRVIDIHADVVGVGEGALGGAIAAVVRRALPQLHRVAAVHRAAGEEAGRRRGGRAEDRSEIIDAQAVRAGAAGRQPEASLVDDVAVVRPAVWRASSTSPWPLAARELHANRILDSRSSLARGAAPRPGGEPGLTITVLSNKTDAHGRRP